VRRAFGPLARVNRTTMLTTGAKNTIKRDKTHLFALFVSWR